jgi:hypothetical protein
MPITPKTGCIHNNIYNAIDIITTVANILSINGVKTIGVDGWNTKYATKSMNRIISKGDALNLIEFTIIL